MGGSHECSSQGKLRMACHQRPEAGEGQELSRPDRKALVDPLGSTRSPSRATPGPEVMCGDPCEGEGYYPRPQPGQGRGFTPRHGVYFAIPRTNTVKIVLFP